MTPTTVLPVDSKLVLTVPIWNPSANSTLQEYYIDHAITSCQAVTNSDPNIACSMADDIFTAENLITAETD